MLSQMIAVLDAVKTQKIPVQLTPFRLKSKKETIGVEVPPLLYLLKNFLEYLKGLFFELIDKIQLKVCDLVFHIFKHFFFKVGFEGFCHL